MIHLNRVYVLELARSVSARPEIFQEFPVLVEFHDALVVISIGDENISGRVPGHVSFTIEHGERAEAESFATSAWRSWCVRRVGRRMRRKQELLLDLPTRNASGGLAFFDRSRNS